MKKTAIYLLLFSLATFSATAKEKGPTEWVVSSFVAFERSATFSEVTKSESRLLAGVDVGKNKKNSKEVLRLRGDFGFDSFAGNSYQLIYSSKQVLFPSVFGFDVGAFKGQRFESIGQIGLDLRWQSNVGFFFRKGNWSDFVSLNPGMAFETSNYFQNTSNDLYGSMGLDAGLSKGDQDFQLESTTYLLFTDGDPQSQDNSRVEIFTSYTYWLSSDIRASIGMEYHRYFAPTEIQKEEYWRVLIGFSFTLYPRGRHLATEVPREIKK